MRCRFITLSLFIGFILFSNFSAAQSFSKLVVFGDSLSDTGNLASVSVDFPFPFFENRISNGPVLADFVGAQIGSNADASEHLNSRNAGFNYAISGGNIVGSDREDLTPQIDSYLSRVQGQADPQALYFVFMGGNDLRDIRSINLSTLAIQRITRVVDTVAAQIIRIASAGGTTFLIPNVPNIGRIPQTLQREPSDPGVVSRARDYSVLYNQMLTTKLSELRAELEIDITEFDLFSELERVFDNAQSLGFTQTQVGCFELESVSFEPDCVFGTRFDRFVFFDSIHPTARTNELIAQQLTQVIPETFFDPRNAPIISPILQLLLE